MMDSHRHSLDIPISRTLVALRRVKSLRDPSTNSMSKLSALIDNVKWETNSSNGISLRFDNGSPQGGCCPNGIPTSDDSRFNRQKEEKNESHRLHCIVENSNSMACQNAGQQDKVDSSVRHQVNYLFGFDQKPPRELYVNRFEDNRLDLVCLTPSTNPLEDVGSCDGPTVESSSVGRTDHSDSKWNLHYENQLKLHGPAGGVINQVGGPYPFTADALTNHSSSLFMDGVDILDDSQCGCGIGYCWSRTPRLRESYPVSEFENIPLLTGNGNGSDATLFGQSCWKCISQEVNPYSETPRSLSQKFRPKSFDELVGQNVVVKSLLNAISKGRVTTLYIFHGPRGTGKTSTSRIFAAALNCLSHEENKPCGECRECILYFSGKSRDVKEVDCLRINRTDKMRSLIKSAYSPPSSMRFRVYIFDECQLLQADTWATLLTNLENLSQRVVFVMITPNLDKLPRSAVSRSQKYHFPKIKDAEISNKLVKICTDEGIDFDHVALDFIATKSNGSLREAEMMLDQLSLLGKRITISLTYELIGTVSDNELLDLLDLALSSDTSNTVIRARELMRSKIDPMQLVSQLANLIMDILAAKPEEGSSEARTKFLRKHTSEQDLQKLSQALRIFSETEKQLRVSKNQTTWLTVALLQLNSLDSGSLDANDMKYCMGNAQDKENDSHSVSSFGDGSKHLVPGISNGHQSCNVGLQADCNRSLEAIWDGATELCQSSSLKKFLRKKGKLSSLCLNQGLAIAELEFHRPSHVSRAEKSWKLIANSLQLAVGRNVEIRINLAIYAPESKSKRGRKTVFSLFSCSRGKQQKSRSNPELGADSEISDNRSEKPIIVSRQCLTCSSGCGLQSSQNSYIAQVSALRNSQGNILSTGTISSRRSLQDDTISEPGLSKEGRGFGSEVLSIQEPDNQSNYFPRTLRVQKLHTSDICETALGSDQQQNKLAVSFPVPASFQRQLSSDPYVVCCSSDHINSTRDDKTHKQNPDVLCKSNPKKGWRVACEGRRWQFVERVLPCAAARRKG